MDVEWGDGQHLVDTVVAGAGGGYLVRLAGDGHGWAHGGHGAIIVLLCNWRITLIKLLGKCLPAFPALRSVIVFLRDGAEGGHIVRLAGDGHGWAHRGQGAINVLVLIIDKEEEVPAIKPVDAGDVF